MALIVKIMGSEDAPDEDTRKTYRLISNVVDVQFYRTDADVPMVALMMERGASRVAEVETTRFDREGYEATGNVYVMNEHGKTISKFGCCPIPKRDEDFVECIECGSKAFRQGDDVSAQQTAVEFGWVACKDGFLCHKSKCREAWARKCSVQKVGAELKTIAVESKKQRGKTAKARAFDNMPASVSEKVAAAEAFLKSTPGAVEGDGGNAHTMRTAVYIKGLGVSQEKCRELMAVWNHGKCVPQWSDDELVNIIKTSYNCFL